MTERGPIITQIIQAVAELPDRTSPEDRPEMMLVSCDELEGILESHLPPDPGSLICAELAIAAEALLETTPQERYDPRTWFGRVDALKLAIKVARGEIPHGPSA